MKWVTLRYRGYPSHTVITVMLNEGNAAGPATDGNVSLFVQQGNNDSTRSPLKLGDNQIVAQVQNGQWESQPLDLGPMRQQGYNCLVAVSDDSPRPVYKTFAERQPATDGGNSAAGQRKQPKVAIEFTGHELVTEDGGKKCLATLNGRILADGQPLKQVVLDFYWNGQLEQQCQLGSGIKTDDNGRFSFAYAAKPANGKRAKLEVQIRGGASRAYELDIPEAPKQKSAPKPNFLTAYQAGADKSDPTKTVFTVVVWVRDQQKQPLGNIPVNIIVGDEAEQIIGQTLPNGIVSSTVVVPAGETVKVKAFIREEGLESNELLLKGPEKKVDTRTKIEAEKRFKLEVAGETLSAPKFSAVLPILTLDEYGQPGSSRMEVSVIQGRGVDFISKTGTILATNATYYELDTEPDGRLRLGVYFPGQREITLEVRHSASGQKRTLKLIYKQW